MLNRRPLILIPLILLLAVGTAAAKEIQWMSQEELVALIDDADTTIIDVRLGNDWINSDAKIKGAVRENPSYIEEWIQKYAKDDRLVFY